MKNIRVGGVPEHFNLPWHLAMENKDFEEQGIKLTWRDFPDGTGAMCRALRDNEIDVSDQNIIDFLYDLTEKKIDIDNPKYKKN